MRTYIIGAGGVGSWLAPSLALLLKDRCPIHLIDGDTLETKNLNRQLFTAEDIGRNKAEALAQRYQLEGHTPKWFSSGLMAFEADDVLLVAVDNHTARAEALTVVDRSGCLAIIGANETHSAEAYVYRPEWKDGELDPRVYYPEITTDRSGDPRRAAIGCTGEAQVQTPQLVSANYMAAALMQHLFIVWVLEYKKFDAAARPHLPYKLVSNLTRLSSDKVMQAQQPNKKENHVKR